MASNKNAEKYLPNDLFFFNQKTRSLKYSEAKKRCKFTRSWATVIKSNFAKVKKKKKKD